MDFTISQVDNKLPFSLVVKTIELQYAMASDDCINVMVQHKLLPDWDCVDEIIDWSTNDSCLAPLNRKSREITFHFATRDLANAFVRKLKEISFSNEMVSAREKAWQRKSLIERAVMETLTVKATLKSLQMSSAMIYADRVDEELVEAFNELDWLTKDKDGTLKPNLE